MSEQPGPDPRAGIEAQRIANDLRAAASSVTPRPDIGEVESGAARVRSRRRAATGVAAAAIVAAAGGAGFGLGRAASTNSDSTAALETPTAPAESSTATTAPPATESTTTESTAVATVAEPSAPADRDVADAAAAGPIGSEAPASASDVRATSSYYPGGPVPFELLSERIDDSGERIRVLSGPNYGMGEYGMGEYPSDWFPAEFCWPTGELRVTFDSPSFVDVAYFGFFTALFDGLEVQMGSVGTADGQPRRLALVQTDTDATDATVTWTDGLTGTAPVVGGIAIVAVDDPADPNTVWELGFTIDLSGPSGTTSATNTELDHFGDPAYRAACEEPPAPLPDAGEQPADANAGQALADRFAELWSRDVVFADKPENLLDDWAGVVEAAETVMAGSYADAAATAERTIDEYVFTSPTDAWLRYTLVTNMGTFSQRYTTATLVDGKWQFPRAAVCQDFGLATSGCQPPAEPIYPPSWYERFNSECINPETGEPMCEAGVTTTGS